MNGEDDNFKVAHACLNLGRIGIYGREDEIKNLRLAYERVLESRVPEIVLLEGYPGTGKTVLANTLSEGVAKGYFITGKFDEIRSPQPFSAIVDAFSCLCETLRRSTTHQLIDSILQDLSINLGEDLGFLALLLPAINALFLYRRRRKIPLPPRCSELKQLRDWAFERIKAAFREFIQVLSKHSVTTAVFIDDLQWADSSSLELLQFVLTDKYTEGLLFVGAYRQNDVNKAHRLAPTLDCIIHKQPNLSVNRVTVTNLSEDDIGAMIADILETNEARAMDLAQVVHVKTNGNAFFTIQFLRMLQTEELLYYSSRRYRWEWNLEKIRTGTSIADNVVDLVSKNITNLSAGTVEMLKLAACLGPHFHFEVVLAVLVGSSNGGASITREQLDRAMDEASDHGLVLNRDGSSKYRFAHDKVQQVAYSLIADDLERQKLHLKIGRLLRHMYDAPDLRQDWMFLVFVDQLNRGASLISDPEERQQLAELNLEAATTVTARSAFFPAGRYLKAGQELMKGFNPWKNHYCFQIELMSMLAETLFVTGELDRCQQCCDEIISHATKLKHKFRAFLTKINAYGCSENMDQALQLGYRVLEELGEPFPRRPHPIHGLVALQKLKRKLQGKTDAELMSLPELRNETKLFALKVLASIVMHAYFSNRDLEVSLISLRMVTITIRHGFSEYSAQAFAAYGHVQGTLKNFREAHRMGVLSLKLECRLKSRDRVGSLLIMVHSFLQHLKRPLHEQLDPFLRAHQYGMEAGDLLHAAIGVTKYSMLYFLCGLPLRPLADDTQSFSDQLQRYNQTTQLPMLAVVRQGTLNLMGQSDHDVKLTGVAMDQDKVLADPNRSNVKNRIQSLYFMSLMLAVYFEDNRSGKVAIENSLQTRTNVDGTAYHVPTFLMFMALAAMDLWRRRKLARYRRLARQHIRELEVWVKNNALNCHHKLLLLYAERTTLRLTDSGTARHLFEEAIAAASRSGFLHDAALANELAGKYHVRLSRYDYAELYLCRALILYSDWGAQAKVTQLLQQYDFLDDEAVTSSSSFSNSTSFRGRSRFSSRESAKHENFDPFQYGKRTSIYGLGFRRRSTGLKIPADLQDLLKDVGSGDMVATIHPSEKHTGSAD